MPLQYCLQWLVISLRQLVSSLDKGFVVHLCDAAMKRTESIIEQYLLSNAREACEGYVSIRRKTEIYKHFTRASSSLFLGGFCG